uniref:ABI family, member 3 (NESH) binding protein b n=1 Tax=Xiphophorus couchianus TaxID=32473 RepID=A0A3B5M3D9_9TELE
VMVALLLRVLLLLLIGGTVLLGGSPAQRIRVRRQNMKVRINATGDTIVMKFVRPGPDVKLEGYILGYGRSVFSKQFIQLPENGQLYETELDAEPKYLVAVQPIPVNDMKKHCTGKVNLEKPLHLVIGSISPTAVLLSWGNHLKTPYEKNVMSECLEDGFYTIRYRERNRKWIYQTCPASDTVIDHLKPDTQYEFGVRSNKDDRSSLWSKPVIHSTNTAKNLERPVKAPASWLLVNRPEKSRNPEIPKYKVPAVTTKPTKQERRQTTTTAAPTAGESSEPQRHGEGLEGIRKLEGSGSATSSNMQQQAATSSTSGINRTSVLLPVELIEPFRPAAPHVVYQTGKKPDEPCSITSSLNYFPEDEPGEVNVTSPPTSPPANLTVVTVEGCPSFIILDWEKPDNHTTEYEVISTAKGPDGERVSILTTNQTHTAVENLNPESSYEFTVKPKNELGEGPVSEPVSFNTESADPRVSENVSGKDAIWTQFPFKTDSYSDCHGKQYVKRTWYRKFVGVQLCNSLRYKIYLSDALNGKFYHIGDQSGFGEDHCQFVDSFLDGRTGRQLRADQLPSRNGFFRALRQEPVHFGQIGGHSHINYVSWYECGTPIPGKW